MGDILRLIEKNFCLKKVKSGKPVLVKQMLGIAVAPSPVHTQGTLPVIVI